MTQEYYLVEAESAEMIGKMVSDKLQQGWKLYGNTIICPDGSGSSGFFLYAQSLVKEVEQRGPWS